MHSLRRAAIVLAATSALACASDDATGIVPIDSSIRETTINASSTAYISLAEGPATVTVTDPAASGAWDLALNATTITSNAAAGVQVHCLCANATATNAEIAAMSAASQLGGFGAVTAAQIPADTAFRADVFSPALTGWYTGAGAAAAAAPGQLLLLRRGTTAVTFVKARVTAIGGAAAAGPASVTLEIAVQPTAGAVFNAPQTITLAAGERYDFAAGALGSAAAWDVQLDGWNLRVNSGVSGAGSTLGIGFPSPFAALDAATAAQVQPTTFRRDGVASQFGVRPWYRYNVTGTDNQIWPTFNVYLVKRGTEVHKVQLTGYYNLAGEARNISIRSARLQ